MPQIKTNYIDTGKVKYVYFDFPLKNHQFAFKAAEAAACAGEQNKYREMHDVLLVNYKELQPDKLSGYAELLQLDMAAFDVCLGSGKYTSKIQKETANAQKAGVTGTPTFLLGLTDPKSGQVRVTVKIRGAKAFSTFQQEIDKLLAK